MATSGTSAFNLNIIDVIEEAYERCGLRLRSGYDITTARRSLDLLSLEWQNRGINFWTVEQTTVSLAASTSSVTLASDTIDVIEVVLRTGSGTSQIDYPMERISVSNYAKISNKNVEGRPLNYWVDKQRDAPVMYLWPVPDVGTYTLLYYKLRRIEDTGTGVAADQMDVPTRFLPALVAGLAVKIAQKRPAQTAPIMPMLMADYERVWSEAEAGDRDRSSWTIKPRIARL